MSVRTIDLLAHGESHNHEMCIGYMGSIGTLKMVLKSDAKWTLNSRIHTCCIFCTKSEARPAKRKVSEELIIISAYLVLKTQSFLNAAENVFIILQWTGVSWRIQSISATLQGKTSHDPSLVDIFKSIHRIGALS